MRAQRSLRRPTERLAPALAWSGLAVSIVAFGVTAVMIARQPEIAYMGGASADIALSAAFLITAALGAAVTQRHPGLSIGWIFSAIGVPMVVTLALVRYGMNALALAQVPELWVLWVMQWLWIPSISLMATALPLLFPNGAPPSSRWTPVVRAIPVSLSWCGCRVD